MGTFSLCTWNTKRIGADPRGRLGHHKKTNSFPYSKTKKTQVGLVGQNKQQGKPSKNLRPSYLLRMLNRRIDRANKRIKANIGSITASNLTEDEDLQADTKISPAQKQKNK